MPVPAQREVHRRTLLRDDVYGSLCDAIVRGQLTPGEQLRDAELSSWLGVSRTPIREALLRLSRAGLVNATPGRLTVVAPEDPQRVAWARQIAGELHALAARLATGALTDEQFASLESANEQLATAIAQGGLQAALDADDDFHAVLTAAAGNPLIDEQLETVMLLLRRQQHLHPNTVQSAEWPRQHEGLIAALRAEDGERAAALARESWAPAGN